MLASGVVGGGRTRNAKRGFLGSEGVSPSKEEEQGDVLGVSTEKCE